MRMATAQHERHGGEDDGHDALALGFAALLAIAGEHGDEGDGGGSADEEVGEHVGQLEGGVEGVGGGAASEEPAMYLTRTRAMTRERMAEPMSSRVAVKAVWLCEGRSTASALRQRGVVDDDAMKVARFYRTSRPGTRASRLRGARAGGRSRWSRGWCGSFRRGRMARWRIFGSRFFERSRMS